MKRGRLRSRLFSAAFIVSMIAAWIFFAPSQIGGASTYVITRGISMEPRFHTGDLAIVRPASSYKVGEIVAYHSTLLHVIVLHRIIARHGNLYVFKGDNNNFIDPTFPTRSELVGKLWLRVPQGGRVLTFVHSPGAAAVLCALLGVLLVFGAGQKRRRRRRRRNDPPGTVLKGIARMTSAQPVGGGPRINFSAFLAAAALAAAVFLVLGAISFTRAEAKTTQVVTRYTQQVNFGYSADATAGPVYPTGMVRTGDPIFLTLVHQLGVHVNYRFTSVAQHNIRGTEEIVLQLTAGTGWTRSIVLTPRTRFTGDGTSTVVTLDLPQLQSLVGKVGALTGMPGGSYTIGVEPKIHITGTVAGHPLRLTFSPSLSFQLTPEQLMPGAAPSTVGGTTSGGSSGGLTPSRTGAVGMPSTTPATLTILGVSPAVSLLRWISVVGLLLSILAAAFLYLRRRSEPFEETLHIQSQYGHMIVPIVGGEDLGWPPVDVPNIKALVMLAESGQRLILHNRANDIDTYMVNDEGTVYRYQVRPANVVWGEWSEPATPVQAAA